MSAQERSHVRECCGGEGGSVEPDEIERVCMIAQSVTLSLNPESCSHTKRFGAFASIVNTEASEAVRIENLGETNTPSL